MKPGLIDVLVGRFCDGRRLGEVDQSEYLVLSIIGNLERLFNSRRDALQHLPDYGLPDVTEIYRDMPGSLFELQDTITAVIEKYEPRLKRIRVEHLATDPFGMRLSFVVTGELSNRQKVQFQTTFSSHEMVNVSRLRQP